MRREQRDDYQPWLWGEVLLLGLLGAALALFVAYPSLRSTYALPQSGSCWTRPSCSPAGSWPCSPDPLLGRGRRARPAPLRRLRVAAAATLAFSSRPCSATGAAAPRRGLGRDRRPAPRGLPDRRGAVLAAPHQRPRPGSGRCCSSRAIVADRLIWVAAHRSASLPPLTGRTRRRAAAAADRRARRAALLALVALVGFGLRYRERGDDLDRWLALAATLCALRRARTTCSPRRSRAVSSRRATSSPALLRRAARRRVAGDPLRRVRARRRGGARARRARDPRRARPVPVRALDAREHARERCRSGETLAQLKEAARGRPAGGAVRGARALLGRRHALRSTPRCAGTSTSSQPTAKLDVDLEIEAGSGSRRTSRSRCSGSCRKGSQTPASTQARAVPGY